MAHIVERLSDCPAMVFSRFGEVLFQTRPAIALFGDLAAGECRLVEVGVGQGGLRRYRHAEVGELELSRQLLMDSVENRVLMVFTALPGSPSEETLRVLTVGRLTQ